MPTVLNSTVNLTTVPSQLPVNSLSGITVLNTSGVVIIIGQDEYTGTPYAPGASVSLPGKGPFWASLVGTPGVNLPITVYQGQQLVNTGQTTVNPVPVTVQEWDQTFEESSEEHTALTGAPTGFTYNILTIEQTPAFYPSNTNQINILYSDGTPNFSTQVEGSPVAVGAVTAGQVSVQYLNSHGGVIIVNPVALRYTVVPSG